MIEEIDGREIDDLTAAALAVLRTDVIREVLPDDPPEPAAEVAEELRLAASFRSFRLWLQWDDERRRLLGAAVLHLEHTDDNQHLGWVELDVAPDARRQGLGRRLLRPLAESATAEGRGLLMAGSAEDGPGHAFALAVGASPTLVEHQNRLPIAELDPALLESWISRAPERASAYSLVAFDDRCPDDLLDRYCRVVGIMNTAPRGEAEIEDFGWSPQQQRELERSRADRRIDSWRLCARHDASGELAGFTELALPPHRPWMAWQGDTGVDPAHRNCGLGRWLKALNLRRLLDERPNVQMVETYNAGSNEPMLAINHALGFRRVAAWAEVQVHTDALLERLQEPTHT